MRASADDVDRWARIRMVAHAIRDADLDDDADVIRAAFAARLCVADFADVLDDVVDAIRELQKERKMR